MDRSFLFLFGNLSVLLSWGLVLFETLNQDENLGRMFSLVSVSTLAATILICKSELECALRLLDVISCWFLAKAFWHVLEQGRCILHLISLFRGAVYRCSVWCSKQLTGSAAEGKKFIIVYGTCCCPKSCDLCQVRLCCLCRRTQPTKSGGFEVILWFTWDEVMMSSKSLVKSSKDFTVLELCFPVCKDGRCRN